MSEILKNIYYANKIYFIPLFFLLIFIGIVLITVPIGTEFFLINPHHTPFYDTFFYLITYLGNGLVQAIILLPLLFIKFRVYILIVIAHLTSGLFAQIIKIIFEMPRPKNYFSHFEYFYIIPNEVLYSNFSFPSGHTTSIFSLSIILAIITKNKFLKVIFLIIAILVGFSRIYLLQHFLLDVYFGMIIGSILGLLVYVLFAKSCDMNKLHSQTLSNFIKERKLSKSTTN